MADMGNMFSINSYIDKHETYQKLVETDLNPNTDDIELQYSSEDVKQALEWSQKSGYPIIVPTLYLSELDELMENFESYPEDIKKASDEISIQYFGVPNETHYEYLKKNFLQDKTKRSDITESAILVGDSIKSHIAFGMNESVPSIDRARDLIKCISIKTESYETVIRKDVVDKVTDEYKASNQNLNFDVVPYEDLPFYTPEEIIDAGVNQANPEDNLFGVEPVAHMDKNSIMAEDGDTSDWIQRYQAACCGFDTYNPTEWVQLINQLQFKKKFNPDMQDQINQSLLNLGWPPEAEFSPENRVIAKNRIKAKMNQGSYQFVDLTGMDAEDITEATDAENMHRLLPVYIILQQGDSIISNPIQKITHSPYSHASISFDPNLKEAYSYGINNSPRGPIGGLVKEDITKLPIRDKNKLEINVIFLKKSDWEKLKENVEVFARNVMQTSYGYINLIISHIFKIPMKNNKKHLVCSEFVDKILKLGDIDISNKDSSLVSPADMDKYGKENKKIYTVFEDIYEKLNVRRIKNLVTRLTKKADPIKENYYTNEDVLTNLYDCGNSLSALQEFCSCIDSDKLDKSTKKIYETFIQPMLYAEAVIDEAQNLPVQFDKEGNLFIKNMKKRNYEVEYAKSHRLLKQYEESGNYESMKYELCRLWAMNETIEENMYSKGSRKDMKVRARILNDFNKYMKIILAEDSKFNFQEYFEKSQFSDAVVMINKETIDWSTKIIGSLLTKI